MMVPLPVPLIPVRQIRLFTSINLHFMKVYAKSQLIHVLPVKRFSNIAVGVALMLRSSKLDPFALWQQ